MSKTVLFQTILFTRSTQYNSIWPIDRTLSAATIPDQREPGSDGNEEVLRIPQSSDSAKTSLLDCLVPYQDTRSERSYPSTEKQLVHYTAQADCGSISTGLYAKNTFEIATQKVLTYNHCDGLTFRHTITVYDW